MASDLFDAPGFANGTCMHCEWPQPAPKPITSDDAFASDVLEVVNSGTEEEMNDNKLNCTLTKKACTGPADCPFEFPTHMDFCGTSNAFTPTFTRATEHMKSAVLLYELTRKSSI